ncbi:protein mono-ADP-ribosyltransferase PARP12-like isoform X2 [Salminus brasiliensis]|uniref:protein mono-ADP-ribosyltransferase PARP12-like isoform X2 n=1 Tax=Salminus brasiliensis TaxID=930266 RepID=UPI003B8357F0
MGHSPSFVCQHFTQLQKIGYTETEAKRNLAVMQTAALVNRLLCTHDGRMELEDLYGQLSGLALKDEVENLLKDTDMFVTTGEENEVVVAKTRLRLCRARECQGCSHLHLCKMYLLGDCPYGKGRRGCRFCHDLYTGHNVSVRRQHNLLELDRSELCVILLQNDNSLLPQVCFTYNKGSGDYGHCPDKEACRRLHVCENYIRGTCDGSTGCSRCHDLYEPHPMKTLQAKGVPSQLMGSVLTAYKNILSIWDSNRAKSMSTPINTSEKSEICPFHLKGFCKQGNRCRQVHFYLPYKWEGRERHGWKVLPDNEEIERAFCDPTKKYSDGTAQVYFDTMTQGFTEVRRLSTFSSVLNPTFILTTTWIWYWEDENGNWIKYGSSNGAHHSSSISSEDLERKYQEDSSATIEFTAGQHFYELNMQEMIQSNKNIGTKRLVRRRPLFLTAEDAQRIKTRQGDILSKKTAGKENTKLLFHGTKSKHVDAICQQNFDWRICGVHGTAYGKGSYFARDASYSHRYTDDSGTRCMFACLVLVGEYINGHSSYVRPPLKDGEDTVFYDSCVDDINNPSIFVVFEKHQVYPEYLIQYDDQHAVIPPIIQNPPKVAPPARTLHSAHLLPFNQLSKPITTRGSARTSQPKMQTLTRSSRAFGSMTSLANLSINASDSFEQQNPRPQRSNLTHATRQFGSLTNLSMHAGALPTLSLHSRPQARFPRARPDTKSSTVNHQSWVV